MPGLGLNLNPHELGIAENGKIEERAVPAQFIVKEGMQSEHPK
jgi:hypothetical protein